MITGIEENKEEIMVSIIILAYNHEKFISQAIESVLNQKTNFKYEIVIGEDCSQDGTRSIVRKYYNQNKSIIVPLFYRQNQGGTVNLYRTIKKARGKYLAFCEGDDFWCDEERLQRDVDFLERHDEYIGVSSLCRTVDEEGEEIEGINQEKLYCLPKSKIYSMKDFINWKMPGHASCITVRNYFANMDCKIIYQASQLVADRTMAMLYASSGYIYRTANIVSCYRHRIKPSEHNFTSDYNIRNMRDQDVILIRNLEKWLAQKKHIKIDISYVKKERLAASVAVFLKQPTYDNMCVIVRIINNSGHLLRYFYYAIKAFVIKFFFLKVLGSDKRVEL